MSVLPPPPPPPSTAAARSRPRSGAAAYSAAALTGGGAVAPLRPASACRRPDLPRAGPGQADAESDLPSGTDAFSDAQ